MLVSYNFYEAFLLIAFMHDLWHLMQNNFKFSSLCFLLNESRLKLDLFVNAFGN